MELNSNLELNFREIVSDDIRGDINPKLRDDNYLELWYQELIDIKINAEIKLFLLEDSEFQQGSMNHHRAMGEDRDSVNRTKKFIKFCKMRIFECEKLIQNLRSRQYKLFKDLINNPLISTDVKNLSLELKNCRTLLDRNNHYLLNNALTMQKTLGGFKLHKEKENEQKDRLWTDKEHFKNLIKQIICLYEDGESLDDVIEQCRLVTCWNVPFGAVPKNHQIDWRKTHSKKGNLKSEQIAS